MLSYDDLAIFVAVVENGSFVAAAGKTNIPSSTLSRRLRRLEDNLKVKLLERTSRKIRLTERGKVFYDQCLPLIQQLKENAKLLTESNETLHGKLKITAPTYVGNQVISDVLVEFIKKYPEIDIDIILSNSLEDLIDEDIDVAIRVGPLENSNFVAQRLWDIQFVLCASPEYLHQSGLPGSPDELNNHKAVVLDTVQTPWRFFHKSDHKEFFVSPPDRVEVNDFRLAIQAVSSGVGISCIPVIYAMEKFKNGKLIPLLSDYEVLSTRTVYAVCSGKRYLPMKTKLFIDYIKSRAIDFKNLEAQVLSSIKKSRELEMTG